MTTEKLKLIGIDEPATVTPAGHGLYIEKVGGLSIWLIHTRRGYRIAEGIHSYANAVLLAGMLGPLAAQFGFDWSTAEPPTEDNPQWDALRAAVRQIAEGGLAFIAAYNTATNLRLTPAMVRYILLAERDGWLPGLGESGRDMRTEDALARRGLVHDDRLSAALSRRLNERGREVRAILRAEAGVLP